MAEGERGRRTWTVRSPLLVLLMLLLGTLLVWGLRRHRAQDQDVALERELAELWGRDGRSGTVEPPVESPAVPGSAGEVAAETVPEPEPEQATEPDDLQRIDGIGPVLERTLHGLGITTFRQIASLTPDQARRVGAEFGQFRDRIEREGWVEQARALHEAKYGEPVDPAGPG